MSKTKINYTDELILSLKRENALLRSIKMPVVICKPDFDKDFLKELNKPGNVVIEKNEQKENSKDAKSENVNQQKPLNDETTPRDFSNPVWRKFHFKNGKDYELALAGENGILVFRDSIFEAPFDDKDNWDDCTNDYEKCTLKVLLEKWWEDNAPQVLKDNYTITLPEAYNILPDEMLPSDLKGKGQQWEIYKNWRNRICGHHEEQRPTWYWTKSNHPSYADYVRNVDTSGDLSLSAAGYSLGVVPACVPISSEAKSQNLECEEHDLQPSGR